MSAIYRFFNVTYTLCFINIKGIRTIKGIRGIRGIRDIRGMLKAFI